MVHNEWNVERLMSSQGKKLARFNIIACSSMSVSDKIIESA